MNDDHRNDTASAPFGPGAFDLGRFFEAMENARRHWGAFVSPAALSAGLDPTELDKRIADLRTVEQWLSLNLTLVQGSVKALEMQRATVDAMRAFGQQTSAPPSGPDPVAMATAQAQQWWQSLQGQFQQVAESALQASRQAASAGPSRSASTDAEEPANPARPKRASTRARR
jgi:hypothetical protein